jgi:hypothetical protein
MKHIHCNGKEEIMIIVPLHFIKFLLKRMLLVLGNTNLSTTCSLAMIFDLKDSQSNSGRRNKTKDVGRKMCPYQFRNEK